MDGKIIVIYFVVKKGVSFSTEFMEAGGGSSHFLCAKVEREGRIILYLCSEKRAMMGEGWMA